MTAARAGAMAGTEPSDGLRVRIHLLLSDTMTDIDDQVVNALLTQLDKLKHRKNVLVMSTSNLVKAIGTRIRHVTIISAAHPFPLDSAFVDRADIIQYIDLPSREAIYEILRSSLAEIVTRGLVSSVVSQLLVRDLDLD